MTIGIVMLVVSAGLLSAQSTELGATESPGAETDEWAPFCGVYCLYGAMRLLGQEVEFTALLRPEYIGEPEGSSIFELREAATQHGLYAMPLANGSVQMLRGCQYPAILHVKRTKFSAEYNHFVLYVGHEGSLAKILDPPQPVKDVPFYELDAIWGGLLLVVADEPIDQEALRRTSGAPLLIFSIAILGQLLVVSLLAKGCRDGCRCSRFRLGVLRRAATEGVLLVALASSAALVYHSVTEGGLLHSRGIRSLLEEYYAGRQIESVAPEEIAGLVSQGAVIIDAREHEAYLEGHLAGAINIPPSSSQLQLQAKLAAVPLDSNIVVYCQSAQCNYSKVMARGLIDVGYLRVRIFTGGWLEWCAYRVAKEAREDSESVR